MLETGDNSSILPKLSKPDELAKDIRKDLEHRVRIGANWFYWIAGFSAVNTMSIHMGWNWQFFLGLGLTLVVDAFAVAVGAAGGIVPLVIDMAVVGMFVMFGWKGGQRSKKAFITGMIIYTLDAGLLLWFEDFRAAAFHGLALYYIYKGLSANNELLVLEKSDITSALSPSPIQPE